MRIKGIGVVSKEKAMELLTREGKEAVASGDITLEELGGMYKLEQVKRCAKVGRFPDTFRACYKWVPEELQEELTPEQLGKLVDAFYECYGAGKNEKSRG